MKRVFISYSRRNKTFAERLARDLSDAGLEVWVDWRQIQAGELWQDEIFRGIDRSEMLIFCLTPESVASDWCQREANKAREQGKTIIPVMAASAMAQLEHSSLNWMLNIHFINFEGRYEEAFPELLRSLPGQRRLGAYDDLDPAKIVNPFKGLEAFQQTDAHLFFGREALIRKALSTIDKEKDARFLGVVGASGSGKSSLVRAGVIPEIREGTLQGSDTWPLVIFTPGHDPVQAMAQRLAPLREDIDAVQVEALLDAAPDNLSALVESILDPNDPRARLVLVVDQFEEVFTRTNPTESARFLTMLHRAVTQPGGRTYAIITMRADFFDRLGAYPDLARLFEGENLLIVTEMTAADLLRAIEGPAEAVGLIYEDGLPQRILDDVRRQPGSLPLLQYALKELYALRDARRLTNAAYERIGGVRRALATHAETIYQGFSAVEQALMRRVLLRLVEVSAAGEATRRRVDRDDLRFRDVPDEAVDEIVDQLTAPGSRLLIASREIKVSADDQTAPTVRIEIGHEALIREWERFTDWVAANVESLRYGSELLQSANNWQRGGRDVAYLLTGNRLARAEDWLASSDATELQRQFIQASVEQEDKRQQLERDRQVRDARRREQVIAGLGIGLVVAVLLTLFAFANLREARAQENRAENALASAEESARQAQSLALSASANRELIDSDTDLAVMLAVYANQIDNPPPQSQRTLAEVAYAPGTRSILRADSGEVVNAVAFSPDGVHAASADGSAVRVWVVSTGAEVRRLNGHSRAVNSLAFSPDGNLIASGGADGLVIVWNADTGAELRRIAEHRAAVNSVEFSADGVYLLSGGGDWRANLWDVASGSLILWLEHEGPVNMATFNRTVTRIATASDDNKVRIWSVGDGLPLLTYEGHADDVNSVAFTPAKTNIVSASDDGTMRLWNSTTGEEIAVFDSHESLPVNDVLLNHTGTEIASAGDDGTVVVYSVSPPAVVRQFRGHTGGVFDIAYSPTGLQILSGAGDATVRVWDTARAEEHQQFSGHEIGSIRLNFAVGVYTPDERSVLSGAVDNTLRLWDITSGMTTRVFTGHAERINAVAVSPDGTTGLSASSDDTLILWDLATGAVLRTLAGHAADVQAVVYLLDGQQAISASSDTTLILWDLATGAVLRRFTDGHNGPVLDVALTPDGTQVVSASAGTDQSLILWDIDTGEIVRQFVGQNSAIQTVAYSPEGGLIASGAANGSLLIWDAATGSILQTFDGHDRAVLSVDFPGSAASVMSGSQDGTLRLWDIASGFELRRYDTNASVHSVDFRSDGREVLTGLSDATLRTWRVFTDLDDLLIWTFSNRVVDAPTCADRRVFQITPLCDSTGAVPTATPFPLPTTTPFPANLPRLAVGESAQVRTDSGDTLFMRSIPSRSGQVVARLQNGETVLLLDGPIIADGFTWWRVRSADGAEGWSVQSIPSDGLATMLPVE